MKSIHLLAVHFGRLPRYFDYFAHTAGQAPGLRVTVLTDDPGAAGRSHGLDIRMLTTTAFSALATKKLGFDVAILPQFAYKVCDFKPTFGLLFQDLLAGAAFWGCCDTDVLMGDLRSFVPSGALDVCDVISMRAELLTGSLTLWRNTPDVNDIFRQSPDCERVLKDATRHYMFDEIGVPGAEGVGELFRGTPLDRIPATCESITHVALRLAREGRLKANLANRIREHLSPGEILKWSPGSVRELTGRGEAYAYYHLVNEKNSPYFYVPALEVGASEIYATELGFHRDRRHCGDPVERAWRMARGGTLKYGRDVPRRVRQRLGRLLDRRRGDRGGSS